MVMKSISVSLPVVLNANIIDWELLAYEIIEDDTVSDGDLTKIATQMRLAADIVEEAVPDDE